MHSQCTKYLCVFHAICNAMFSFHTDDFTTSSGSVSQYAASFGNSWRVQDHQGQVGNTFRFFYTIGKDEKKRLHCK